MSLRFDKGRTCQGLQLRLYRAMTDARMRRKTGAVSRRPSNDASITVLASFKQARQSLLASRSARHVHPQSCGRRSTVYLKQGRDRQSLVFATISSSVEHCLYACGSVNRQPRLLNSDLEQASSSFPKKLSRFRSCRGCKGDRLNY